MLGTQAPFPVTALPQHPSSEDNTYHGEIAHRSQFVHTDGGCQLVMFGIDGNIYDKDGYLMADADVPDCQGPPPCCQECVEPGLMEMLAITVPGICGLYYILSSEEGYSLGGTDMHVALLDMNEPSVYHPGRYGRLLHKWEAGGLYPALAEWADNLITENSYYDLRLEVPVGNKSNAPMFRVIRDGDHYWMYAVYDKAVTEYRIDGTGIHAVQAIPGENYIPTYFDQTPTSGKAYFRDASVAFAPDGKILLAITDNSLYAWPIPEGASENWPVLIFRFDPMDEGALLDVQGIAGDASYPDFGDAQVIGGNVPGPGLKGPAACAWIDDGTKLLVTGLRIDGNDWVPAIAAYDMVSETWDDLLQDFSIPLQDQLDYVLCRAHRNTAPSGTDQAIYLPHQNGLAAITGVDDGTYAFVPEVSGPPVPSSLDILAELYLPHFINAQVTGDNSVEQYNRAECCQMRAALEGHNGYTFPNIPGNYHWYADDNPFGNCGDVLFTGNLVIPADVNLYIHDMTLRFGPEARMIVRARGYASAQGSFLTNEDCLGPRWPGIRVEGDPDEPLQSEILQGRLHLYHTTVDDAEEGVWCGRDDGFGRTGGIVRTYWSTFRDCLVGARIGSYHRIIGGIEQSNKCSFNNTTFEVTPSWPDLTELPKAQIHVFDVNGVSVNRCAFTNVYSAMGPHDRGVGILSFDASYRCRGFGDFANNRFYRLAVGVLNMWNDPLFASEVDGMHFDRNLVGLYDMGCLYSRVTNNRFTTMTNGTPLAYLSMGMYIDQSAGYLVERNYFEDIDFSLPHEVHSAGIWFHGNQPAENRIYDNEFHGLTLGNVAEGLHHGLDNTGVVPVGTGLQWLCNLYEGERVDQLLLSPDGSIRQEQGSSDLDHTAGNVFVGPKDCQTQYEPVVFADHYAAYTFDDVVVPYVVTYHYYAHDQSPDNRPECVEDENNISITATGNYYNLAEVEGALPFNPAQHCNGGILDALHKSVQEHKTAYAAKYAELRSVALACAGQLDNGERVAVMDAIKAVPAWPSHSLRGYLLAHSPLSEEAIIAAIYREDPMDPWHLTEVLIANSRLSDPIWAALDHSEALSPFFYQMVLDHQEDPSVRDILMEELALRAHEKDMEQRLLVLALHEDSTYTGKLDTLLAILSTDTMGFGRPMAYQLALAHGRSTEAAALATALAGDARFEQLLGLGALQLGLDSGWSQAGHNEVVALESMAASGQTLGRGAAWGILYALGATDSLPTGVLPMEYRSAQVDEADADPAGRPVVGAYPNPAKDRLMITWPAEADGGTLEVTDARGRLVLAQSLAGHTAFVELDVRPWADGLYLARVLRNGQVVGETKCAIAR